MDILKEEKKQTKALTKIYMLIVLILVIIVGYLLYKEEKLYLSLASAKSNYFTLIENNKSGIVNEKGEEILKPEFSEIYMPNKKYPVFFTYKDGQQKIYDKTSEIYYRDIVSPIKNSTGGYIGQDTNYIKYDRKGKKGVMDIFGKKITNPLYDDIFFLKNNNNIFLVKNNNKYGVLNEKRRLIVPIKYDVVRIQKVENEKNVTNEYIVGKKNSDNYQIKYGVINSKGKEVVPVEYDNIYKLEGKFEKQFYLVTVNGKTGLYEENKVIISPEYDYIAQAKNILFMKKNEIYEVFSLKDKAKLDNKVESFEIRGDGLLLRKGNETIVTDENLNNLITNLKDEKIDKIVKARNNDKDTYFGIFTGQNGKKYYREVTKNSNSELYDVIYDVLKNTLVCGRNNEFEIINLVNNKKVKSEDNKNNFITVVPYEETNIILAKKADGTGAIFDSELNKIDIKKETIIENIKSKKIVVLKDSEKATYLDYSGHILKEEEIKKNINSEIIKKEKFGMKLNDKVIVPEEYDFVGEINEYGYIPVIKDSKWGSYNKEGKKVLDNVIPVKSNNNFENVKVPVFVGKYIKTSEVGGTIQDFTKTKFGKNVFEVNRAYFDYSDNFYDRNEEISIEEMMP